MFASDSVKDMIMQVMNSPNKEAVFWLNNEEACDRYFIDKIKPHLQEWKAKGYLPVIIKPGDDSLEDEMYMLMKHTLEISAKRDDKNKTA